MGYVRESERLKHEFRQRILLNIRSLQKQKIVRTLFTNPYNGTPTKIQTWNLLIKRKKYYPRLSTYCEQFGTVRVSLFSKMSILIGSFPMLRH